MTYPNDPTTLIREGMDVYSSDGEKLGTVGDVNIGTVTGEIHGQTVEDERSSFQVKRGGLFGGDDLWLPADAVDSVDADRITLRLSKDEVGRAGWSDQPTAPQPGGDRDTGILGT